jgi:hypothetical protein
MLNVVLWWCRSDPNASAGVPSTVTAAESVFSRVGLWSAEH